MIWLIVLAALALRLVLTLVGHEGFLGVDGGAYLLSRNAVLGDEPTGAGFPRPPLAPGWLLVPFTELFGDDIGYKLWSVAASLLPILPVYLLARRLEYGHSPALALFAAGFLSLDLLHAEMLVTGALPLIGFALLGMVWWAMGSLAERWSWRDAAILAGCLGLIPWVNQTTAGLALITIPVYLAALIWYSRNAARLMGSGRRSGYPDRPTGESSCFSDVLAVEPQPSRAAQICYNTIRSGTLVSLRRIAPPLLLGGAIALGALPWYMQVLPVTGLLNYPGPFIYLTHVYDSAWWQLLIAWPLGIAMAWKGPKDAPWFRALGVLICLLGTLLVFLSTDETVINVFYRSRYLLAIPFYVGISWAVWRWALPECRLYMRQKLAVLATIAAITLMLIGYISQFQRQTDYSDMATPATAAALTMLRHSDDPNAGVVTNSFTLSLWVAALNKVPSPHIWTWVPPRAYVAVDKDVRCILGWVSGCNPADAAQRQRVGYVLIDSRFPKYNARAPDIYMAPEDPWAVTADTPWLEQVYQRGTTTVWRVH